MEMLENNMHAISSASEQKEYYKMLRNICMQIKNNQLDIGQNIIKRVYPFLRKYKLEIHGEENIPKDSNVIFLCNHSNSHDVFTAYEVLSALKRRGSVMVATDCLNPITTKIFDVSYATLLDRNIAESRENSVYNLSSKILNGYDGWIFGESTWNLHPTLPMHNIRKGASTISAITQAPIIPTIIEYIEEEGIVSKESELYKKCIIRFGKPIMINPYFALTWQTNNAKEEMVRLRKEVWEYYGIHRDSLSEIDLMIYLNHTYLKKFGVFGFTYNSEKEQEFLLFLNGEPRENEYTINENGEFVPGITPKNEKIRKLLIK